MLAIPRIPLLGLALGSWSCFAAAAGCSPPSPVPAVRLAVYLPGGNLEDSVLRRGERHGDEGYVLPAGQASPFGAASDDLRELVAGYGALTPAARRAIDVRVAFGGARKASWAGVKHAGIECLIEDAADDVFGNAGCYSFRDPDADLSSAATLQGFLESLAPRGGGAPPPLTLLVLWGQGGGTRGMFYDSAKQEIPFLRVNELRAAFARSGAQVDLLGMDAGLMASVEVLAALAPFASVVVASQDAVPGHGWDYAAVIAALARRPWRPPEVPELAREIVDRYLDGTSLQLDHATRNPRAVAHRNSRGKTISALRSAAVAPLVQRLDELVQAGSARGPLPLFLGGFARARGYAYHPLTGEPHAVDLADVARRAARAAPAVEPEAAALLRAISAAVVHGRSDPSSPAAGGLSVFSPRAIDLWRDHYRDEALLSPRWQAFLTVAAGGRDEDESTQRGDGEVTVLPDEVRFTIGAGAVDAFELRGQSAEEGRAIRILRREPPEPASRSADGRQLAVLRARWGGEVLWLCGGPCARAGVARAPVPTRHVATLPNGHELSQADAEVRPIGSVDLLEEATLIVQRDPSGAVVDSWAVVAEGDTNEGLMLSRDQYRLAPGISVAFPSWLYRPASGTFESEPADFIDLVESPEWTSAPLPAQPELVQVVVAEDVRARRVTSPSLLERRAPRRSRRAR